MRYQVEGKKKNSMPLGNNVFLCSAKIFVQVPPSLCIDLLFSKKDSSKNWWPLGATSLTLFQCFLFFVCLYFRSACTLTWIFRFYDQNVQIRIFFYLFISFIYFFFYVTIVHGLLSSPSHHPSLHSCNQSLSEHVSFFIFQNFPSFCGAQDKRGFKRKEKTCFS